MTSGGSNFNYFPENQLTKFKVTLPPPPSTFLFLSPQRISLMHFATPGCLWTPLRFTRMISNSRLRNLIVRADRLTIPGVEY